MPEPVTVFLQPCEMVLLTHPARVKTVLGSCVGITMRAPASGVAAMVHCLLPTAGAPYRQLPAEEYWRYVDAAVDRMLEAFATRGAAAGDLEVKLFGGADRLAAGAGETGYRVGRRNVKAALASLAGYGIEPVSREVGGRCGRLVEFDTASGSVFVKLLPSPEFDCKGAR
jgi:chemotaxis protein CheD